MIQTTRLRNGVTVVSRALPERHSAALGVWLLNGTRYEAAHESGYAHLLEHLLFKGTPELDAVTLACRFDAMGGQIIAFSGRELTAGRGRGPGAGRRGGRRRGGAGGRAPRGGGGGRAGGAGGGF